MKWLLLLTLIACGKEQMPSQQDLGDADGDQILNNLEEGEAKYFAQVDELPFITGVFSYTADRGSQRFISLEFSNQRDLQSDVMKMLTHSKANELSEEHFSEWSRLRFKGQVEPHPLKETLYEISLVFATPSKTPNAVYYKQGDIRKLLGTWKKNMKFNLSADELDNVLTGKAHLELSSEWLERKLFSEMTQAQSLTNNTYRVFFYNGEESKILYISKLLTFRQLLKLLNIEHVQNALEQEDLISPIQFNSAGWWLRDLGEDKILLYAPTEAVAKAFRDNHVKTNLKITRSNGQAPQPLKVTKADEAKLYLMINAGQINRIFHERSERITHSEMRGRELGQVTYDCDYKIREVARENPQHLGWEEVWQNLEVRIDGQLMNWEEVFLTKQLETTNGPQLILGLRTVGKEIELKLKNRPTETYVPTGRISFQRIGQSGWSYLTNCYPNQNIPLNTEAQMTMNIDAYIEKL